ncbi:conjugation system SOS inhibitor PsiB [Serratia sp. N21D137]|uniref:conjugation system SOS inhibitor PsiB n=1 Tax=Serratia sp. N21D137 TaxID=3397495 RepID=UPI0039E04DE8
MTKEEKFTLSKLQSFTATDFEQYRDRGDEARLRLSSAVITALSLPECWQVDCEQRQEWGGLHPVHLRMSHQSAPQLQFEITGPCNDSPYWYGRLWFDGGECAAWFYSAEAFTPEAINGMMAKVDEYIRAGYTEANKLAVALRMGGNTV